MREHHFFDDPAMPEIHDLFARVVSPIAAANSTDDQWVPPRSRDAFFRGYVNAPITAIDIEPAARSLPPLGHIGYFRASAEPLWHEALDWFDEHTPRATA
jgi:predicted alpha/beta hydrolase